MCYYVILSSSLDKLFFLPFLDQEIFANVQYNLRFIKLMVVIISSNFFDLKHFQQIYLVLLRLFFVIS